jgi:hypothetical protein
MSTLWHNHPAEKRTDCSQRQQTDEKISLLISILPMERHRCVL